MDDCPIIVGLVFQWPSELCVSGTLVDIHGRDAVAQALEEAVELAPTAQLPPQYPRPRLPGLVGVNELPPKARFC
jgi:hypothetical protein